MTKHVLRRDSFVESAKVRGRSRRKTGAEAGAGRAEASGRFRRNDILPSLRIEHCAVDALKLHVRQLRKHDRAHVREIAEAISTLGFNVPVLIGKNDVVIDGGSRVEAAKLLGLSSVPCIRVDHLDETEQRLLRLAVNRLGEKGVWDLGELEAEFKELVIADAPIEISGFEAGEIEQLIAVVEEEGSETVDLAPSSGPAIARVGDLFRLGDHYLICGDARDPTVIRRLMGQDVARFVFTDGPIDVAIGREGADGEARPCAKASGEATETQLVAFHRKWIEAVHPYLVDGGLLGAFIDWRGLPIIHAAATAFALTPLDLVVWAKTNAGTGSLFRSQHELLPLFKKGSAPHVNNFSVGKRGRLRTNLWTYPQASPRSGARKGRPDNAAEKPAAMLEDGLIDLTNRGDIVLDPFLGIGATLIAAENAGRACRGVELDPLYVDVVIRRYEAATGAAVILADTGESFETVAARRRNDESDERD